MTSILFLCHGNICRSPMAEFIMKKLAADEGMSDEVYIESAAVSREETGNDIYPPAKRKLAEKDVPFTPRKARTVTPEDADRFDLIIVMEEFNMASLRRIIGECGKVSKLLDFTDRKGEDISDPWFTGDFETAYNDICYGCMGLINTILNNYG
ncbi:MAG: low molecular weight phosphotyrosine protein phosphatase [Ruminococcus sp.]|nr:low molecular weight phosphotyrosine protein phosphatase [Ruminococcus sp.]